MICWSILKTELETINKKSTTIRVGISLIGLDMNGNKQSHALNIKCNSTRSEKHPISLSWSTGQNDNKCRGRTCLSGCEVLDTGVKLPCRLCLCGCEGGGGGPSQVSGVEVCVGGGQGQRLQDFTTQAGLFQPRNCD